MLSEMYDWIGEMDPVMREVRRITREANALELLAGWLGAMRGEYEIVHVFRRRPNAPGNYLATELR